MAMTKTGFQKVNAICKSIIKLADEDIADLENVVRSQVGFVHPLKGATQMRTNAAGRNNERIIEQLKQLRETIKAGEQCS